MALKEWNYTDEFDNDIRYSDTITIAGPFINHSVLRLRSNASSNTSKLYFDDITLEGCLSQGGSIVSIDNYSKIDKRTFVSFDTIEKVDLYPNPNNGRFTLEFNLKSPNEVNFIILDISGRILYAEQQSRHVGHQRLPLNLENYPEGIYFLKIQTEEDGHISRFVINR